MFKQVKDGIQISIKATPRASQNAISGWEGDNLKIRLKAIPEKGNANETLCEFLAEYLEISPSQVLLIAGHTGRLKRVLIRGVSMDKLREKLAPEKKR